MKPHRQNQFNTPPDSFVHYNSIAGRAAFIFGGTMEQHVRFIRDFCVALAIVWAFAYFFL